MRAGRAVVAGLAGGVAMTLLGWLVRQSGIELNTERMLGTMLTWPAGAAWLVGFAMHLMLSALFALAYAWGFEHITHRAGAMVGAAFAVIHIVLAGIAMTMIPAIHPMIPEQMPAPGAFMAGMGATFVALFIIEHLLYGSIVGATYGRVGRLAGEPAIAVEDRRF
ncbi:MAG TPA: hypothetical protein VJ596_12415 [Gemmatimonadaceae bacterium]|nr:hypothetical protein [Gemmatimonadaceae bacterium]